MQEFSVPLANAVRASRLSFGLTQNEVSEMIDVSTRTILNIENNSANPKMHVLYPLIRQLEIDPNRVFFPERSQNSPIKQNLYGIISRLSEKEAEELAPLIMKVIKIMRK